MAEIKIPKTKYSKVKALTETEATGFYDALMDWAPAKYRAYFLICLQTGTRRAEAGGLKWDKIDLERHLIRIETTMQYGPKTGIYEETPKTVSSVRNLKMTDTAADALCELKREYDTAKEAIGPEWNPEGLVFTTEQGTPMHPNTPYTWLKRFQKKHDFKECSIHRLRHTNATLLMAKGLDAKSLMGRLGHTDLSTTDKYLDFISEKEDVVSDTMAGIFGNGPKE